MKVVLLMITLIDVFHTTIVANEVSQGRKIQYRNYNRKKKLKRVKNRVNYYANCVILAGGIEQNSDLCSRIKANSETCKLCNKSEGTNRKFVKCRICYSLTHVTCLDISKSE